MKVAILAGVSVVALHAALASGAAAGTVGVTVGANQSVTNSDQVTANVGVEFTGDGSTFTNALGATITATPPDPSDPSSHSKIMSGSDLINYNIPYNNLTINNAGTMQYTSNPGSGAYFAGNAVGSGNVQTGVTSVNNITVNNASTGVIAGLDTSTRHDDVPLSFEDGTNGAVVNNAGTISTAGGSMTSAGIRVSAGVPSYLTVPVPTTTNNIVINNQSGGAIRNTTGGAGVVVSQFGVNGTYNGTVSNVAINNAGTIIGGAAVPDDLNVFHSIGAITIDAATEAISGPAYGPDYGPYTFGTAHITGVTIANTGTIDGTASGVAIDNSRNTAAASITNSGTIKGNILFGTGGDTLTLAGGTIQTSTLAVTGGATLRGTGTIQGNVNVGQGSTVKVGGSPDALTVKGDYTQTGGTLKFEIDPNGSAFLTSTLVLGSTNKVSLTNTQVVFDFVGGADPTKFALGGGFNVDTFFRTTDGGALPADDLSLVGGNFVEDNGGIDTALALGPDGSFTPVAAVPEPASLLSFCVALGGMGWIRRRKPT